MAIAKITKGASATQLARYLHGPGKHNEHTYEGEPGGRVIDSNFEKTGARNGDFWARKMNRLVSRHRKKVSQPIWQCSIRLAPDDRNLTDKEFSRLATSMLDDMGAAANPYVVVRHAPDHVHIVVCRVGWKHELWNPRHDYRRVQDAMRTVEKEHRLTQVQSGKNRAVRDRIGRAEREIPERGGASWTKKIRDAINDAMNNPAITTDDAFLTFLRQREISRYTNKKGEWVYTIPAQQAAKKPRAVKGETLGNSYTRKEISHELATRQQQNRRRDLDGFGKRADSWADGIRRKSAQRKGQARKAEIPGTGIETHSARIPAPKRRRGPRL